MLVMTGGVVVVDAEAAVLSVPAVVDAEAAVPADDEVQVCHLRWHTPLQFW